MIETDPQLHGFWGYDYHTMTSQCSEMGIPTFQLEMPPHVRVHLAESPQMLKKFAELIVNVYNNMIVPDWETTKETPILYRPNYASKVHE